MAKQEKRVERQYVCTGLRVSSKHKPIYSMVCLTEPDNVFFVDGKAHRNLFNVYTMEHPEGEEATTYYTKSIMWSHPATKAELDAAKVNCQACEEEHLASTAYFERKTQANAKKRIEKDMRKELGDYTIKELSGIVPCLSPAERRAMVGLIMEKMGLI